MQNELERRFRQAAAAHGAGKISSDVEATNLAFDRMIGFVREIRRLPDNGREVFSSLLHDADEAVRSAAATYLLPLDEERAIAILEEIEKSAEPLIGLTAEMVLREWRAGRLEIP